MVEDDVTIGAVHETVLRTHRHDVTRAATGFEAVQAIRQAAFDLALLDPRLPDRDGIEACRDIRARLPGSRRLRHRRQPAHPPRRTRSLTRMPKT
ncbi:hypothetical protein FRACA_410004 [Frankia canadensis]|uniref:Response regulatory domain-containing protein n=1 Tax=Frankia canadensis TaxID=1836972 RepID=A0A2I2KWU6_9ACTN|nr:response regulator [Frankia canadensis]SNQ50130.1 hypothetical protein FRACA_410004 [Frankia canadensis]SOU57420.1 hypothetical protein FRACA_410004 [Frankia canadensis]